MQQALQTLVEHGQRQLPIITMTNTTNVLSLAERLISANIPALEITLRTPEGLDAIKQLKQHYPRMLVAAGSVTHTTQMEQARQAGADLIVTPGVTPHLLKTASAASIPLLPGTANASDIMLCLEYGFSRVKVFPIVAMGGIPYLKALAAPFPEVRFCPTGGITQQTASDYLSLECVDIIAGTWMLEQHS